MNSTWNAIKAYKKEDSVLSRFTYTLSPSFSTISIVISSNIESYHLRSFRCLSDFSSRLDFVRALREAYREQRRRSLFRRRRVRCRSSRKRRLEFRRASFFPASEALKRRLLQSQTIRAERGERRRFARSERVKVYIIHIPNFRLETSRLRFFPRVRVAWDEESYVVLFIVLSLNTSFLLIISIRDFFQSFFQKKGWNYLTSW